MDEEYRGLTKSQTPGTYEYKKRKALRKDYGKDTNIWGKKTHITKEEAHEYMLGRMSGLYQYPIPRELAERVDMTPAAKLVYGFMASFRRPTLRLFYREIAGMCGLDIGTTKSAVYDLVEHGYLKKWNYKIATNLHGPTLYKLMPKKSRNVKPEIPSIMKTDITNIEDKIRERFHDA